MISAVIGFINTLLKDMKNSAVEIPLLFINKSFLIEILNTTCNRKEYESFIRKMFPSHISINEILVTTFSSYTPSYGGSVIKHASSAALVSMSSL